MRGRPPAGRGGVRGRRPSARHCSRTSSRSSCRSRSRAGRADPAGRGHAHRARRASPAYDHERSRRRIRPPVARLRGGRRGRGRGAGPIESAWEPRSTWYPRSCNRASSRSSACGVHKLDFTCKLGNWVTGIEFAHPTGRPMPGGRAQCEAPRTRPGPGRQRQNAHGRASASAQYSRAPSRASSTARDSAWSTASTIPRSRAGRDRPQRGAARAAAPHDARWRGCVDGRVAAAPGARSRRAARAVSPRPHPPSRVRSLRTPRERNRDAFTPAASVLVRDPSRTPPSRGVPGSPWGSRVRVPQNHVATSQNPRRRRRMEPVELPSRSDPGSASWTAIARVRLPTGGVAFWPLGPS